MGASPLDAALLAAQFPDLTGITYVTGGGQKWVYTATHAKHGTVALKVFSDFTQRTPREVEAVQKIACPHVPEIFATGFLTSGSQRYFWLLEPWLHGDNLRTRLAAGALSDELVLLVARDVLCALSAAEKNRIVHRDVKPENIYINSANTKCWLLDFGIARHLERSTLTRAGAGQGPLSAGYAPPEQIQNYKDKIDSRTDLFALGVTLYEALMGVNPFTLGTTDPNEILRRVMNTELPRPIRDIDPDRRFSDLVMVMTRSRRSLRPRTALKTYEWLAALRASP